MQKNWSVEAYLTWIICWVFQINKKYKLWMITADITWLFFRVFVFSSANHRFYSGFVTLPHYIFLFVIRFSPTMLTSLSSSTITISSYHPTLPFSYWYFLFVPISSDYQSSVLSSSCLFFQNLLVFIVVILSYSLPLPIYIYCEIVMFWVTILIAQSL